MQVVEYVDQYYRLKFKGRGIPVLEPDMALMSRAKKLVAGSPTAQRGAQPAAQQLAQPPSAGSDELKAISLQMGALLEASKSTSEAVGAMQAKVSALGGNYNSLSARLDRLAANPGLVDPNRDKNMVCNYCKQKGHRVENCPNKPSASSSES